MDEIDGEAERERALNQLRKLGPLEQLVLERIAQGMSYEALAKAENLSLATVAVVCDAAAAKLEVSFPDALEIAKRASA